jgi:hypothetical protein
MPVDEALTIGAWWESFYGHREPCLTSTFFLLGVEADVLSHLDSCRVGAVQPSKIQLHFAPFARFQKLQTIKSTDDHLVTSIFGLLIFPLVCLCVLHLPLLVGLRRRSPVQSDLLLSFLTFLYRALRCSLASLSTLS